MIERIFSYHILWKEYRQMRGFWLSVLALTVMLQLVVFAISMGKQGVMEMLFALAMCFSALYALGVGGTTFALEHENGTYDFLRALPTRALPTFFGKVAFTAISTPLLLLAASASAVLLCTLSDNTIHFEWEALFGSCIGTLLFFVWATFYSLLVHHAVRAALLGGVTAAFTVMLMSWLVQAIAGLPDNGGLAVALVVILVLVTIADVWLGARWYREATTSSSSDDLQRRREEFAKSYGAYEWETVASKGTTFAHLLWLQWRQSRGMIFTLTILAAWFIGAIIWIGVLDDSVRRLTRGTDWRFLWNFASVFFGFGMLAGYALIPAAGASVFSGDQKLFQFRFLADRGISAKMIWWSRQPVWAVAVAVWVAVALAPVLFVVTSSPLDSDHTIFLRWYVLPTLLCTPLAYCFGQFCSMMTRSGILCVTVAIAGSVILMLWAIGMFFLGVPLFWSVLPIPVILLVATRVRTRGWLIESNALKSWLPVLIVLLVPSAAILAGVAFYRAYSIPMIEPGFDVAAFRVPASPQAIETAKMYQRASEMLEGQSIPDSANTEKTLSPPETDEAVALILEASRRSECDNIAKYLPFRHPMDRIYVMTAALYDTGSRLEKEGDLEDALEHYLAVVQMLNKFYPRTELTGTLAHMEIKALSRLTRWSTAPGQSSANIAEAIRKLEQLTSKPPVMDTPIKARYVRFADTIDADLDDLFRWKEPTNLNALSALMIYWMPWERERAHRLLNTVTRNDLETYRRIRFALENNRPVTLPHRTAPKKRANDSSPYNTPDAWLLDIDHSSAVEEMALTEMHRRATLIKMALVAWQLDKKSLPESLDELTRYLAKVPNDPFSGKPFLYYPRGADSPVIRYANHMDKGRVTIEAEKPFFWSLGSWILIRASGVDLNRYEILDGNETRRPASWEDLWTAGWIFPIPQPR